jgi:hypothetical protein
MVPAEGRPGARARVTKWFLVADGRFAGRDVPVAFIGTQQDVMQLWDALEASGVAHGDERSVYIDTLNVAGSMPYGRVRRFREWQRKHFRLFSDLKSVLRGAGFDPLMVQ